MSRFDWARLLLAASIAAGLALGACGESPADRGDDELVPYAGEAACKDLSDEDCAKKGACVLEQTCSTSGICSKSVNDSETVCDPPVECTSECKHWKNAHCSFLAKNRCDRRDDCEWMCVQLAIGCPPDDPDCGVHCGCNSTVPDPQPPISEPPGVIGGSPPIAPEEAQAEAI